MFLLDDLTNCRDCFHGLHTKVYITAEIRGCQLELWKQWLTNHLWPLPQWKAFWKGDCFLQAIKKPENNYSFLLVHLFLWLNHPFLHRSLQGLCTLMIKCLYMCLVFRRGLSNLPLSLRASQLHHRWNLKFTQEADYHPFGRLALLVSCTQKSPMYPQRIVGAVCLAHHHA